MAEIAVVLMIAGLMLSMLMPAYYRMVETEQTKDSKEEIVEIAEKIDEYFKKNGQYPDSLDQVFSPVPLDPWGAPYQYLRIDGGSVKGKGKLRKDKNLVPINSDYDLYSMGPDGESASPLTANPSQDDIVRGRDGQYFGIASDF